MSSDGTAGDRDFGGISAHLTISNLRSTGARPVAAKTWAGRLLLAGCASFLAAWLCGCRSALPQDPEIRRQDYVAARAQVLRAELAVEQWRMQALGAADRKQWRYGMKQLAAARERLETARRQAARLAPAGQPPGETPSGKGSNHE